jgi:hypothetical protein
VKGFVNLSLIKMVEELNKVRAQGGGQFSHLSKLAAISPLKASPMSD